MTLYLLILTIYTTSVIPGHVLVGHTTSHFVESTLDAAQKQANEIQDLFQDEAVVVPELYELNLDKGTIKRVKMPHPRITVDSHSIIIQKE